VNICTPISPTANIVPNYFAVFSRFLYDCAGILSILVEEVMKHILAEIAMYAGNVDSDKGEARDAIILDRVKTLESLARMYPDRYRDCRWSLEKKS
jgi:hypothetical protein